ncbi:hypothetical protein [Tsuneonella amylolytica]|uniref:hypothetical protein n=1 Tax=Tsuneonella amylolytica TaxID=2338327 RepID=UPI000EAA1144|nr:hypothetical protein [Tsuneonella amylolytica]
MNRLFALPLFAAAALVAAPAAAQDAGGDKVRMVIVYGDDAAPAPTDPDEILVVARMPEGDRYRIPEALRFSEDPANMAWARRVEKLELVTRFGTNSCSTAGAGGFTGCTQQLIDAAYADKREGADVRFSALIAAARAERLSTIDADAASEQSRVEEIEREYMKRLEAERAGPTPDEVPTTQPGDAAPIMVPPGQ